MRRMGIWLTVCRIVGGNRSLGEGSLDVRFFERFPKGVFDTTNNNPVYRKAAVISHSQAAVRESHAGLEYLVLVKLFTKKASWGDGRDNRWV